MLHVTVVLMKLQLGTNSIFYCPEGRYRAVLENIGAPNKKDNLGCDEQIRFRFRVEGEAGAEYLVARNFCANLDYGSDLYHFLEAWFEGGCDRFVDDDNQLELDLLVGERADVLIGHHQSGKHKQPFSRILGIHPPGRLVDN
jgi:hypothetical protein